MDANTETKQKREPGIGGVHGTNENVCENYFLSTAVKVEKGKDGVEAGTRKGQCNWNQTPVLLESDVRRDRDEIMHKYGQANTEERPLL